MTKDINVFEIYQFYLKYFLIRYCSRSYCRLVVVGFIRLISGCVTGRNLGNQVMGDEGSSAHKSLRRWFYIDLFSTHLLKVPNLDAPTT
jgi:hypothetical protein